MGLDNGMSSIACLLAQEELPTAQLSPMTRILISHMEESIKLPGVDLGYGYLESRPSPWPQVFEKINVLVED